MQPIDAELTTASLLAKRLRNRLLEYHPHTKGECWRASLAMAIMLASQEITSVIVRGMVNGRIHFWNSIGETWLDITADQFNDEQFIFPDVMVSNKHNAMWSLHVFNSVESNDCDSLAWMLMV